MQMDSYLYWALVGIALIIAELLTGTFYLLVIGIAAFAGAGAAYLGYSFWIEAVSAATVAVIGVILISRSRAAAPGKTGQNLDIGQSVVLDSWVSEADGLARVSYRNALWDAKVLGERHPSGKVFYVHAVEGNTLHVSTSKPV
jgi:membrane protein implicated in regulation of membrane protease activity